MEIRIIWATASQLKYCSHTSIILLENGLYVFDIMITSILTVGYGIRLIFFHRVILVTICESLHCDRLTNLISNFGRKQKEDLSQDNAYMNIKVCFIKRWRRRDYVFVIILIFIRKKIVVPCMSILLLYIFDWIYLLGTAFKHYI